MDAKDSEARFGKISGDVSVDGDGEVSVNLVLVAPVGDLVRSGIHELIVVNDAGEGGDLVFGNDTFTLHPGTERDGMRVGSIPVTIPADVEEFELTTVGVVIGEGEDPSTYDVGDWRMDRHETDAVFSAAGDYPASLSACGEVAFELQREGGSSAAVAGIETGAPGLRISDVAVDVDDHGSGTVAFDLTCDNTYDVYAFSPTLIVEEDGRTSSVPLDQMLVGYLDLTEETVQRILTR